MDQLNAARLPSAKGQRRTSNVGGLTTGGLGPKQRSSFAPRRPQCSLQRSEPEIGHLGRILTGVSFLGLLLPRNFVCALRMCRVAHFLALCFDFDRLCVISSKRSLDKVQLFVVLPACFSDTRYLKSLRHGDDSSLVIARS